MRQFLTLILFIAATNGCDQRPFLTIATNDPISFQKMGTTNVLILQEEAANKMKQCLLAFKTGKHLSRVRREDLKGSHWGFFSFQGRKVFWQGEMLYIWDEKANRYWVDHCHMLGPLSDAYLQTLKRGAILEPSDWQRILGEWGSNPELRGKVIESK